MMRFFNRFKSKPLPSKVSYSQCGEDLIVDYLFAWLQIGKIRYLDIGANDPVRFNNTFRLYGLGHRGVLVEADDELSRAIKRTRPLDICVNAAVGITRDPMVVMYRMTEGTLNTVNSDTAMQYELNSQHRITMECTVPNIHVNDLLNRYFADDCPNFVSIDVEGLDFDLLQTWNFERYHPEVLCVETLTYTQNRTERKVGEIADLMKAKGYIQYADTFLNSIFVHLRAWERRT